MKSVFFFFSILMLIVVFPSASTTSDGGSCVLCHTNDNIMKSMYKPPDLPSGEGAAEG